MSLHDIPQAQIVSKGQEIEQRLNDALEMAQIIGGDEFYSESEQGTAYYLVDLHIKLKADFQHLNDARVNAEELAAERLEKIHWLQQAMERSEMIGAQAQEKVRKLQEALDSCQNELALKSVVKKGTGTIKNCTVCNAEIFTLRHNTLRCPECRIEYKKEYLRNYQKEYFKNILSLRRKGLPPIVKV